MNFFQTKKGVWSDEETDNLYWDNAEAQCTEATVKNIMMMTMRKVERIRKMMKVTMPARRTLTGRAGAPTAWWPSRWWPPPWRRW